MATITSNGPSPISKLKELVELTRAQTEARDLLLTQVKITNAYLGESSSDTFTEEDV